MGASVVCSLDINSPTEPDQDVDNRIAHHYCDVSHWQDLVSGFNQAGDIDVAVSNAGVSEETDFLADLTHNTATNQPLKPDYPVLDVNPHSAGCYGLKGYYHLVLEHTVGEIGRRYGSSSLVFKPFNINTAPQRR